MAKHPNELAAAAVDAAADRDEARLADYTRPPANEQLLDLVSAGADVASVTLNAAGDGYEAVVELSGSPVEERDRIQLLIQPVGNRWVVVEASLGRVSR